jgi:hypothetical protein
LRLCLTHIVHLVIKLNAFLLKNLIGVFFSARHTLQLSEVLAVG